MRDPARIPMILAAIARRWEQSPDLRLGQLLSQLAGEKEVRAIEDGELLRVLGPANDAEREYADSEPDDRRAAWRDFGHRSAGPDDRK